MQYSNRLFLHHQGVNPNSSSNTRHLAYLNQNPAESCCLMSRLSHKPGVSAFLTRTGEQNAPEPHLTAASPSAGSRWAPLTQTHHSSPGLGTGTGTALRLSSPCLLPCSSSVKLEITKENKSDCSLFGVVKKTLFICLLAGQSLRWIISKNRCD